MAIPLRPLPGFLDPLPPVPGVPTPGAGGVPTPAPAGPQFGATGDSFAAYLARMADPNFVQGPLSRAQQIAMQGARRKGWGLGRQPGAPAVPGVPQAPTAFAGNSEFPLMSQLGSGEGGLQEILRRNPSGYSSGGSGGGGFAGGSLPLPTAPPSSGLFS